MFVDIDAPEAQSTTTPDRTPETIGEGQAVDGIASGGIVPPLKLPGAYLSPSAVHQGAASVSRSLDSASAEPAASAAPTAAAPTAAGLAGAMPLAGTPEPGRSGSAMTGGQAGGAGYAGSMPSSSAGNSSAPAPGGVSQSRSEGGSPSASGPALTAARPGEAPLFADLPFDAPNSVSGWLVMVGSTVAAVSFLLPWAPGIVDYTSSWGLSSLSNLPILAVLVVIVILAILPNGVSPWIRSAVLPLIGGSVFLGLLWPYVIGDFGAVFGSIVGAAGAVVLIVGGILAVAPRSGKAPAA
ncbi:MAG: hypothetical protein ABI573_07075 [Chloroflexota bacterium]